MVLLLLRIHRRNHLLPCVPHRHGLSHFPLKPFQRTTTQLPPLRQTPTLILPRPKLIRRTRLLISPIQHILQAIQPYPTRLSQFLSSPHRPSPSLQRRVEPAHPFRRPLSRYFQSVFGRRQLGCRPVHSRIETAGQVTSLYLFRKLSSRVKLRLTIILSFQYV